MRRVLRGLDCGANGWSPVAAEIIHEDGVAGGEFRDEDLLDIGLEGVAVDGTVEDHRRDHSGDAQAGDEGRGLPVAVGNADPKPLAFPRPPALARHVGRVLGSTLFGVGRSHQECEHTRNQASADE